MSPHFMYLSSGAPAPPADTWFNRTQARADARATAVVDLDPTDSISGLNLWTSKPSAIGLNDPIDGVDKVLVAARGSLLLLKDNGGSGDPLIIDDGWDLIEADCRWNQLVKTGSNTAVFFVYGVGGVGYPSLGQNSGPGTSGAYYKYQRVSVSGGTINLIGPLTPMAGIPLWDFRVPAAAVNYKSIVRHITGDIFVQMHDGFGTLPWAMQVFNIGINNAGFPHTATDIYGAGSGILFAGDIAPAAELNSIHIISTNGSWRQTQLEINIGALTFINSGFVEVPALVLRTKIGLALDKNGRLVNSHTGSTLYDFSIATGYTTLDTSDGAQSGLSVEGQAIDNASSGDPDPELIFDLDSSRGGYAQRNIHSMEITGADEDFMQLATNKFAGGRISRCLRVNGITITAAVFQIIEDKDNPDYNTVPFKGVRVTDEYAKKDSDTIYGFYMKKVGGLLRPHGFIMRK